MSEEDDEDFKLFQNCAKCWFCDKIHADSNVKVRGHCHITGKYKHSCT